MSEFPSSLERKVASSLLLLSAEPVFSSPSRSVSEEKPVSESNFHGHDSLRLSLSFVCTGSSGSSLSSDGSSQKSIDHGFRINSMDVPYHLLKLEPVKKRRSKVFWSSINLKNPVLDLSIQSDDSKEESCLSSGSSEVSSLESRLKTISQARNEKANGEIKKKESFRSSSIRRRADAILEFLSASCSSEVTIRQVLGDSPDTSKALRMLLKMEEVKRTGTGGRHDPYIYKIA